MSDPALKTKAVRDASADEIEVLTFEIGGETFALEAAIVREILDLLPETIVPGSRPFVNAVINFRGKVIPLADIRVAMGMPAAAATIDSRIVVVELDLDGTPSLVGLRTDRVNEVATLSKAGGEPPPRVGLRWPPQFIECLIHREGAFIIFPDLRTIFSSKGRASQPD
ncbi:Chemotaxis signal transduction CheW-like protein [uncultured Pleomorphomonas sp.]|uniref:Chemotaxis protein CheW n=2 Tax=Pleomorphomonas TaxID=261933 RepID=A0A2G9WQT5_9HYPH|nr:chemotaxis protein CheW [Pleomorphomonas carboxyditropha]PIO97078.1 chemotaxis protein CheW [Pleomorphomonas carboxyditropha]SCM77131.1 Chemotaxis signal transduction CheW-like protein [uncultured Pleomorphomonas sp.]